MECLHVFPIHRCPSLIPDCCDLINSEWPRSKSARLQSLYMSSEKFPMSLVLVRDETEVVGHVKLTEMKLGGTDIMVESMIIHKDHRGKGWGKILMEEAEQYLERRGKKKTYLSTRGQEGFYKKLGYEVCQPVMYFGFCDLSPPSKENTEIKPKKDPEEVNPNIPAPPPLPKKTRTPRRLRKTAKTYMCKYIA